MLLMKQYKPMQTIQINFTLAEASEIPRLEDAVVGAAESTSFILIHGYIKIMIVCS